MERASPRGLSEVVAWLLSKLKKLIFNMADNKRVIAANLTFLSLLPLLAAFQCCGLMLCQLILQVRRQQQLTIQVAFRFNTARARLTQVRRGILRRRGRIWRHPGRTDQWWQNLYNGVLLASEW